MIDDAIRQIQRSSTLAHQQRFKEAIERMYSLDSKLQGDGKVGCAGPLVQFILTSMSWNFGGKCMFPDIDTMTFSQYQH